MADDRVADMNETIKILFLEDVDTDAELNTIELGKAGFTIRSKRVQTRDDFIRELRGFKPDLILADYKLPSFDGLEALDIVKNEESIIPFIFVTGTMGEDVAIEAVKNGATDYVLKQNLSRLVPAVKRALEEREEKNRRVSAERLLKRSENKFRSIYETAPNLFLIVSRDGVIVDCNSRIDQYLGYGKGEMVGSPLPGIIHPDYLEMAAEFFHDVVSKGFSYEKECEMVRKDGSFIDVSVNSAMLISDDETEHDVVCIIEDITKRKQAENALRESEEKHRILLDESSDPIFAFERDGHYLYVNDAFAKGVGRKVEEIIGATLWDIFPREEADTRFAALSQVVNTGMKKTIEARVPREDGDRYYLTTITPIKNEKGEVVSAICSSKEITGLKNIENQLKDQINELRRWHEATLGRETRIIELKGEVNELLAGEGRPPRYEGTAG